MEVLHLEETVGIREMKQSLSRYIREGKKGKTITITDRGSPVARLSPVERSIHPEALKMVEEGMTSWHGNKPGLIQPVRKKYPSRRNLTDMLSDDRR